MDNIVDILDRLDLRQSDKARKDEKSQISEDRFLIDEGLDLLAAYRVIDDDGVRQAIRTLVEALASSNKELVQ